MGRQSGLTGDEAYAILHNKNGGGSGGTSDYSQLTNKPTLNGVEISGDKTSEDYGIKAVVTVTWNDVDAYTADKTFDEITNLINNGVEIVARLTKVNDENTHPSFGEETEYPLRSAGTAIIIFSYSSGCVGTTITFVKTSSKEGISVSDGAAIYPNTLRPGGIKADPVTDTDTIPVRFNSEDGKAYVEDKTTFIINVTKDDETDTYTADQTFDDAYAAYQAGRNVVMRNSVRTFNLYTVATASMQFVSYQYMNTKAELYAYIKTDGNNKVRHNVYNRYANRIAPGGITAEAKQETDTVPVRIDSETGRAYVSPSPTPQQQLESYIENYYALRRTGKVYQTKLWKFASNPSSSGEKMLDNAGLVFEPSTDSVEGQDDYLNGQNPLFEWVHCNYIRDADGTARPTAIEGMSNYATTGAVDVGAMQMSFWVKWDWINADYDLITISDTPHTELGLVPWTECKKADGTVVPWCIGSAYVSGIASDGKPRSQPGLKPERNQSHNSMITDYQEKGEGYWGAGACRNVFQIIFNAIKGNTKNSQNLYAGVTNWNIQYEASVQGADNHTYFPVTNAQAENIPVGCYVSVGYGGNNNETANNDRSQATIHAYADDVKVINKVALDDGANTAIYLDIPEGSAFNTQPHVYTETFSAPIILSSMHAWSGTTDAVLGHHDGSPVSNTDGKHAYRVQGREYAVGGYIVASDTVIDLQSDFTKKVYVAPKGTAHSSSNATIRSTYTEIGTIPAAAAGNNADWWIGDFGLNTDVGGWWPAAEGSGSSQGTGDRCYAGGADATSGTREYLQGGPLGLGSTAGSAFLYCWYWLDRGTWHCLACD